MVSGRRGEKEGEKSESERPKKAEGQPKGDDGPWTKDERGEERRSEHGERGKGPERSLVPSPKGRTGMAPMGEC